MNGILNVYKEPGFTSHDVVAKLRGICKQKKIGHTGTLDPDASGVLPVCLGNATKLCDLLTDKTKEYRAQMLLGCVTDTQDTTGQILEEHPVTASEEEVRSAIRSFVGAYDQIPPMYSALKVNGRKLCDLARAGKEVERKSRPVTIYAIQIEKVELPCVTMTVSCSKGTYIRTLCHDIGQRLGCGGTMANLVRTRSGQFTIDRAYRLSEIEAMAQAGSLEAVLLPVDAIFKEFPAAWVKKESAFLADNGNPLFPHQLTFGQAAQGEAGSSACRQDAGQNVAVRKDGSQIRIYGENGKFYGIYGWQEQQERYKPVKLFLGKEA